MKRLLLLILCALGALAPGVSAQRARHSDRPKLRVLVPAYFYPVPGSPWVRLAAAAERHVGLVWAIGNPASGPGATLDPNYVATFTDFRRRGGRLLGYVHTSYGARPLGDVLADVDTWFGGYGADGIFVDEMDNTPLAHEAYYRALYQHVLALAPKGAVVGNPGTSSTLDYLDGAFGRCASTLCLFEGSERLPRLHARAVDARQAAARVLRAALRHLGRRLACAVVDHAFASRFGWIYVTDDVLPNPWDTLPAYFEAFVDRVEREF